VRIAHSRRAAFAAGLATLALLGAGCGKSAQETANKPAEGVAAMPGSQATVSTVSPEVETPAAGAPFGAACQTIPSTGAGSLEGMAKDPVATAASNNPALSTLSEAITTANLKKNLNSAEAITVFAPVNEAFASANKATITKAMADPKGLLTKMLNFHVVEGRLSPEQLVGEHKTMQGSAVTITGSGEAYLVNDASIVCGNIQTANATVYLIDKVLMPKA
jgi:uncharacterized surface protein with fasciclin (FAS1) repeats